MNIGSVICAKTIEHRQPVEIKEDKNGKQREKANRIGFGFQSEHYLLSEVGVFIFLGKFPEQLDSEIVYKFADDQLRRLGWKPEAEVMEVSK